MESVLHKHDVAIDSKERMIDDALSLITQERLMNDLKCMALLRICLEDDPHVFIPIIQENFRLDRVISDLNAKLVTESIS